MKDKFRIRAIQMDLARQMEKVEYIYSFIDFAAKYGYNTLFLYLEWRIRCNTFDIGENNGYTAEELRSIVEYAAKKGMDVIPGLALFGHAEQLLRLPEYRKFAELRSGENGREHHNDCQVFCLANPEVKEFIASFLEEVLEIFPSKYIHAGFDEALDVGYCEECREKIHYDFVKEEKLVLDHLHFVRDMIVKNNRRMMIWDDLLPLYPSFIKDMAKDVIICSWQYHQNVPEYYSYCFNCTFKNALKEYRNAGFECIVSTADFSTVNNETFLSYAVREKAIGALVTSWSKHTFTYELTKITTSAASLLMNGREKDMKNAFRRSVKELLGENIPEDLISAIYQLRAAGYRINEIQNIASISAFPIFGVDESKIAANTLVCDVLKKYENMFEENTPAWYIYQELYCDAKCRELSLRSMRAAYRFLHRISGEKLSDIAAELEEGFAGKRKVAEALRRTCDLHYYTDTVEQWKNTLLDMEKKLAEPHTLCRVVFALPLTYGNTLTSFYAVKDGKETLISKGNFKIATGYEVYSSHFEWFFILPGNFEADQLKITAEGFTGTGISFVEFLTPDGGEYVADSIQKVSGEVANPAFLLDKTDTFAYFGNMDGFHGAVDRKTSETLHSIVLNLKKIC